MRPAISATDPGTGPDRRHPSRAPLLPAAPALALALAVALALAAPGCGRAPRIGFTSVSDPPSVQVVRPDARDIVRVVGQPSFIQAYEHTAIYAKLASYIEKWDVDIGDKVKKGAVLAKLFMPELVEERKTKQADVAIAKELIEQSLKVVDVSDADVEAAAARLAESQAMLAKFQAEADRWDTEVKRLAREAQRNVVSPQILLESQDQWKSSLAARDAAKATILTARADLTSKRAAAAKAKVDVAVARARLVAALSDEKRLEALEGYLTLTAPFDGVIVGRNANTGDFVLPQSGDPTARSLSPYQSSDRAAPIYVVDRTDVVRVFVDIPEEDANYVRIGTKATVLARAYRDEEVAAAVTRTSWALNVKSRTLRAEIDLHNDGGEILPGMYAYGKVIIERPGVRAVPLKALAYSGDQTFCWVYKGGKAVRTEVETGVSDGDWVEVLHRRAPVPDGVATRTSWTPIDGSEQVILGDLSILTEDAPVKIAPAEGATKVASETDDRHGDRAKPPAPRG